MMNKEFVSYEIALKLKELGFDEECFVTYQNKILTRNPSNKIDATPIHNPYMWKNSNVHNSIVCAPLWQQVIDWFRIEHKLNIFYIPDAYYESDGYSYRIDSKNKVNKIGGDSYSIVRMNFPNYHTARRYSILEAFNLIPKNETFIEDNRIKDKKIEVRRDIFGVIPEIGDTIIYNPPHYKGLVFGICVAISKGGSPQISVDTANWRSYGRLNNNGYYTPKTGFVVQKK